VVNIRFTAKGVEVIDDRRKYLDRSEYLRQALAFAIKQGFQVPDQPGRF
jgi:hypothetical protein